MTNIKNNTVENPKASIVKLFDDVTAKFESNNRYIIGRTSINRYIEVPEAGYDVVVGLKKFKTIENLSVELEEKYNENVDVSSFIETLIELNFVNQRNEEIYRSEVSEHNGITFSFLKKEHLKWLFSKPVVTFFAVYMLIVSFYLFIIQGESIVINGGLYNQVSHLK